MESARFRTLVLVRASWTKAISVGLFAFTTELRRNVIGSSRHDVRRVAFYLELSNVPIPYKTGSLASTILRECQYEMEAPFCLPS
jgi:hypothetical protein